MGVKLGAENTGALPWVAGCKGKDGNASPDAVDGLETLAGSAALTGVTVDVAVMTGSVAGIAGVVAVAAAAVGAIPTG